MLQTFVASLKAHLNLEHDLDNALISLYLAAAEAHAETYVGQFLDVAKPAVKQAVLMLAGFWYEHREAA